MRLSRPDETDPAKRRHFKISIDSPFNILSCRATQANTSLPAYDRGGAMLAPADEYECGCPGAAFRRRNTPPVHHVSASAALQQNNTNASTSSVDTIPAPPTRSWTNSSGGLALPTQAHVHHSNNPNSGPARPMH